MTSLLAHDHWRYSTGSVGELHNPPLTAEHVDNGAAYDESENVAIGAHLNIEPRRCRRNTGS